MLAAAKRIDTHPRRWVVLLLLAAGGCAPSDADFAVMKLYSELEPGSHEMFLGRKPSG